MYDDILGPVEEKPEEVEINIKPKKKTGKANKGTTLKANLGPDLAKAPTPTEPDDCEELEELDLSDIEELLEEDEDPWNDVDNDGKCDSGCDSCDAQSSINYDPCNGDKCHECNEDCMYSFLI